MRLFPVAAALGLVAATVIACASFTDSSTPGTGSDAGDPETSTSEGGGEGGTVGDGGEAGAAVLTVAHENAATVSVAVNARYIYWWSTDHSAVERVDKDDPGTVVPVAPRPGQTVTALAADAMGVYWLEAGPDMNDGGAVDNRIMRLAAGDMEPVTLRASSQPLSLLAVDATRVTTTVAGGVIGVAKASRAPFDYGFSLSQTALAADGVNVYYIYFGIYRLTQDGKTQKVIGLNAPRQLTVDGNTIYGFMPSDAGTAIFMADDSVSDQPDTAATEITQITGGPLFLAVDNLGLVWANASDGTIKRVSRTGGAQETVTSGIASPSSIAADARGVYWTTTTGEVGWARRP